MDSTDAAVVLEPVTFDSASILGNLFELYAYDFSEQVPLQLKASGRFELQPGEVWWTAGDHFAYFIKERGELAGFALAQAGSRVTNASDGMDVAEFFVLRSFRGRGLGRLAAQALFKTFPGAWEIRVRRTNAAALRFWSKVAESWVRRPVSSSAFSVGGVDWDVLRFVSAASEQPNVVQPAPHGGTSAGQRVASTTSPGALVVRSFRAADRAALEQLWARVFPDDPPRNAPAILIDSKLKVQPDLLLVGAVEDTVVGAVMAGFDGVRGWIYHLAVAPEWRRRGFATQLVHAAEAGLTRLGCPKVNLQIRATNGSVAAFYRSIGYELEERLSLGRALDAR